MNTYTVAPFSGARYRENQARLEQGEQPCAICGKAVSFPYEHSATVVAGGDWARTQDEAQAEDDPGYMGVWGIGPDCHRRYRERG